jgi:hypothetical protein
MELQLRRVHKRTFQIAATNVGLVRLVTQFDAAPWLRPVSELGKG